MTVEPWAKRYRQRHFVNPSHNLVSWVDVPADVEVREESAPCFRCGVRGGCRHRPWMLAA